MPNSSRDTGHLEVHVLASMAEGRLATGLQLEVRQHLATCAECREELYEVRKAIRGVPARRVVRMRWSAAAVAAAAVAAVAVYSAGELGTPPGATSLERSPRDRVAPVFAVHRPLPGSTTTRSGLVFIWAGTGPGSRYEVSLGDSLGTELWRFETTDTVAMPPATVSLTNGVLLYWYVDALLPDGRTATTRALALRIQP